MNPVSDMLSHLRTILAALVSGLCLSAPQTRPPQFDPIEASGTVILNVSVESPHLTTHEPVILSLVMRNDGPTRVHVDFGRDRKEGVVIEILSPSGKREYPSWPRRSGFSRTGEFDVGIGETYTQRLILNEIYDFEASGLYDINVRASERLQRSVHLSETSFHAEVEMEQRDQSILEKRCAGILAEVEDSTSYERAAESALALSFVNDPIAVPYLQKLLAANKLVEPIAINGLERIATLDAVKALSGELESSDKNGSGLARAALLRIGSSSSDALVKDEIRRALARTQSP